MATPWHKFPGGGLGSTPQRLLAHGLGPDYILVAVVLGIYYEFFDYAMRADFLDFPALSVFQDWLEETVEDFRRKTS